MMTLSQGRMLGLSTDDMTYQGRFGTLMPTASAADNGPDHAPMATDDDETGTATVTIGRLPLNTVTVRIQMN